MINRWITLIILSSCVCASATQWTGIRSEHITLFTDRDTNNAKQVLLDLENARVALRALGFPVTKQGKTTTVILTSKQSDLRDVFPLNVSDNGTMGGLTYSYEDRIYVLADTSRPEARRNLLHEYVHALVGERFVGVPRWIDEGIAEHYSTLAFQDGEASLGPLDSRRRWKQGECPKPGSFRQILSVEPNSFIAKSGSGAFYLPAAVVVRYLIEEYGVQKLYTAIEAFRGGTSMETVARSIYDRQVDEIEAAALESCKSGLVPKEHGRTTAVAVDFDSLPDAAHQFDYAFADILARTFGHQDQAIKRLQDLMRTNSNDALAKRGIGIALIYKKDFDRASTFLQDSFKSLPGDMTTLYHLVIACTNSSNCSAEDYVDDVKVLLSAHPYLGKVREWSAEVDRLDDGEDSPYLPDEKAEPVTIRKK